MGVFPSSIRMGRLEAETKLRMHIITGKTMRENRMSPPCRNSDEAHQIRKWLKLHTGVHDIIVSALECQTEGIHVN